MELLKKIVDLILEFLKRSEERKIEKEEIKKAEIEQIAKTKQTLERRKNETINPKPPTDDNFFND